MPRRTLRRWRRAPCRRPKPRARRRRVPRTPMRRRMHTPPPWPTRRRPARRTTPCSTPPGGARPAPARCGWRSGVRRVCRVAAVRRRSGRCFVARGARSRCDTTVQVAGQAGHAGSGDAAADAADAARLVRLQRREAKTARVLTAAPRARAAGPSWASCCFCFMCATARGFCPTAARRAPAAAAELAVWARTLTAVVPRRAELQPRLFHFHMPLHLGRRVRRRLAPPAPQRACD